MSKKRPLSITLICIFGILSSIYTIPQVFSEVSKQIAPWYPSYLAVSVIVGIICVVGLWRMKKWGVEFYAIFALLTVIFCFMAHLCCPGMLLVPITVIVIGLLNYSSMD